ncbi:MULTISPECIES: lysoplasmalogenase [Peribacillus]|uniref:lysoplasmalogenase n=1 Tax=Peribacillus TaxID=2675229 RepID=UPI001F4ED651|nr:MULTISPECIES: lysoplasmalogenase [unclassified Peribacillus]MCK1985253.1 lysoplasmalogenase [Peribacillus sp. Aquil_B1]MCK2007097.1 lysoplasmalogenase [Peribacillus sp. Aquil_B8]
MLMKCLPAAITITGLLYIFFIPEEPLMIKIMFKVIPMLLILLYAYTTVGRRNRYQTLILLGLFFCMLGDGLLIWFVIGLSAFLIGHLFYISAFFRLWSFSWLRFATIVPICIYSTWIGREIVHSLIEKGEHTLIIPVICYVTVISLMGWAAFMTGNTAAIIGGVLFVISDSILSWNKFIDDVAYSGPLIMLTYYAAQFCIANSIRMNPPFHLSKGLKSERPNL